MLTIIIISYNSSQVLTECLGPLIDSNTYPVFIIDNASTDGSVEALRSRYPDTTIKALPVNIGYGRAANVGLSMVETDYGLLLNPDLTTTPEEIGRLLERTRSDTASTAVWGPASLAKDYAEVPPTPVEWISGCAMLFDMPKLRTIGFFDENIFLFFEETDLCARVRDAGYEVKFCADVLFNHMLGQATPPNPAVEWMKNWHYGWSRCYYFSKWKTNKKRTPERQYVQYRRKAWIALSPSKRRKYKAQAAGAKAFLNGIGAFRDDGTAQAAPTSSEKERARP